MGGFYQGNKTKGKLSKLFSRWRFPCKALASFPLVAALMTTSPAHAQSTNSETSTSSINLVPPITDTNILNNIPYTDGKVKLFGQGTNSYTDSYQNGAFVIPEGSPLQATFEFNITNTSAWNGAICWFYDPNGVSTFTAYDTNGTPTNIVSKTGVLMSGGGGAIAIGNLDPNPNCDISAGSNVPSTPNNPIAYMQAWARALNYNSSVRGPPGDSGYSIDSSTYSSAKFIFTAPSIGLPLPTQVISANADGVYVWMPTNTPGYKIQISSNPADTNSWVTLTNAPTLTTIYKTSNGSYLPYSKISSETNIWRLNSSLPVPQNISKVSAKLGDMGQDTFYVFGLPKNTISVFRTVFYPTIDYKH